MNSTPYKISYISKLAREIDAINFKHSNNLITSDEYYNVMDKHKERVINYIKKCYGIVSIPLDTDEHYKNYLCYILNKRTDKVMKIKYSIGKGCKNQTILIENVIFGIITDISCYIDDSIERDTEEETKRIKKIIRREYKKFKEISDMPLTDDYIHYIYMVLTAYF